MAQQHIEPLLDPAAISRAASLGLNARYIVEGYMAGEHKSPYRGFAVEFAQHREYTHGDDTRHLDWKVLGRTDRYYIKQYEQETNYVANILLDGSESMKYGDSAALGIFDQTMRDYSPRSDNRATIHRLMARLAAFQPTQETGISTVLHDMANQLRRKGIVIVISDFFDDEAKILEGIQHLRFGGHEVVCFHVMDPYELEFPFTGLVEFEGLENVPKILTRPAELRKTYLREVEAFRTRPREGCEKNQSHYVLVNTAEPLHEVLSGYLAFRLRTTTR